MWRALLSIGLLVVPAASAFAGSTGPRLAIISRTVIDGQRDLEADAARISERVRALVDMCGGLQLGVNWQRGTDDEIRKCGSDTECVSARLRPAGFELALAVVVDETSSPVLVSVRLLDVATGRPVAREVSESNAGVAEIDAAIDRTAERVLEAAGYSVGGRLIVEAAPASSVITVDGLPAAPSTRTEGIVVAPGPHQVSVTADDHQPMSRQVKIEKGRTERVLITLERDEGSVLSSPWLWAGVGVAVTAAVVGVVVVANQNPPFYIVQCAPGECPEE